MFSCAANSLVSSAANSHPFASHSGIYVSTNTGLKAPFHFSPHTNMACIHRQSTERCSKWHDNSNCKQQPWTWSGQMGCIHHSFHYLHLVWYFRRLFVCVVAWPTPAGCSNSLNKRLRAVSYGISSPFNLDSLVRIHTMTNTMTNSSALHMLHRICVRFAHFPLMSLGFCCFCCTLTTRPCWHLLCSPPTVTGLSDHMSADTTLKDLRIFSSQYWINTVIYCSESVGITFEKHGYNLWGVK